MGGVSLHFNKLSLMNSTFVNCTARYSIWIEVLRKSIKIIKSASLSGLRIVGEAFFKVLEYIYYIDILYQDSNTAAFEKLKIEPLIFLLLKLHVCHCKMTNLTMLVVLDIIGYSQRHLHFL